MPTKPKKRAMTAQHKTAIADAHKVRRYLKELDENKPKRGRKRTSDSVRKRLATIEKELPDALGADRLRLIQERRNLEVELARMQGGGADLADLEKDFVKVAKSYSSRNGITYGAWREFGVSADVLKKAGITRGS